MGGDGFLMAKFNGRLIIKDGPGYESRNPSTQKIIRLANEKFDIPDFGIVKVNTGDVGTEGELSYSTATGDYSRVIPDFIFDCWKEVQISDYTEVTRQMSQYGDTPPETNLMGWRGANTHPNREILFKFTDTSLYDIEEIRWNRDNPAKLTCSNYVSIQDSVRRWRYLIDVEGVGWSARVKLLLFSKRVLFLQDRPHKEWYWPLLVAWEHYVPVARDLSDLEEKLMFVKQNPDVEEHIRMNAHAFAQEHLTFDKALERWRDVLSTI